MNIPRAATPAATMRAIPFPLERKLIAAPVSKGVGVALGLIERGEKVLEVVEVAFEDAVVAADAGMVEPANGVDNCVAFPDALLVLFPAVVETFDDAVPVRFDPDVAVVVIVAGAVEDDWEGEGVTVLGKTNQKLKTSAKWKFGNSRRRGILS